MKVTEALRWFQTAVDNFELARMLRQGRHYWAACFHAQQAAEMALKAILIAGSGRLVFTHSVSDLIDQAVSVEPKLRAVQEAASDLDQFYTPTRYPDALPSPVIPRRFFRRRHAESALKTAGRVLQIVEDFLRRQGLDVTTGGKS